MRYRLALLFAGAALISKRGPNPDGYPKREISKRSACDARIGVEIVTQTEQKNPTHRSEFARGAHGSEGAAVRCRHWANGAVGTLIPKLRLHILQDRARNFPLLSQLMTGGAASRRLAVFVTIYAPLHLYYLGSEPLFARVSHSPAASHRHGRDCTLSWPEHDYGG